MSETDPELILTITEEGVDNEWFFLPETENLLAD